MTKKKKTNEQRNPWLEKETSGHADGVTLSSPPIQCFCWLCYALKWWSQTYDQLIGLCLIMCCSGREIRRRPTQRPSAVSPSPYE